MSRKLGTANIRCGDLVTCVAIGKPLRIVFVFGIFNNEGGKPLENKALGTENCNRNLKKV